MIAFHLLKMATQCVARLFETKYRKLLFAHDKYFHCMSINASCIEVFIFNIFRYSTFPSVCTFFIFFFFLLKKTTRERQHRNGVEEKKKKRASNLSNARLECYRLIIHCGLCFVVRL